MTESEASASRDSRAVVSECKPFSRSAAVYDDFYDGQHTPKDYEGESAIYLKWLNKPRNYLQHRLLEIGCGTGGFTGQFEADGWEVIGIDSSAEMVSIATDFGFSVIHGDIADPLRPCVISAEAAVAAFAVMSYACAAGELWNVKNAPLRCTDEQIIDTVFQNVRKSLPVGGRFVFDVVNAACAMTFLRHTEHAEIQLPNDCTLGRRMDKRFDPHTSIVTSELTFRMKSNHQKPDLQIDDSWREIHRLRAFMPGEIAYILHKNGFRPLAIFPMEASGGISETGSTRRVECSNWYTMVAAEAV